jgi:hypothetical protein
MAPYRLRARRKATDRLGRDNTFVSIRPMLDRTQRLVDLLGGERRFSGLARRIRIG